MPLGHIAGAAPPAWSAADDGLGAITPSASHSTTGPDLDDISPASGPTQGPERGPVASRRAVRPAARPLSIVGHSHFARLTAAPRAGGGPTRPVTGGVYPHRPGASPDDGGVDSPRDRDYGWVNRRPQVWVTEPPTAAVMPTPVTPVEGCSHARSRTDTHPDTRPGAARARQIIRRRGVPPLARAARDGPHRLFEDLSDAGWASATVSDRQPPMRGPGPGQRRAAPGPARPRPRGAPAG